MKSKSQSMSDKSIDKIIAERQAEIVKLQALWQYVQELNLSVGLNPETLYEIRTKISSRIAQCEISIRDHS